MTKKPNLADALCSEQRVPQPGAKTPENNGEKIQLNFRLDPEVLYKFKLLALEKGRTYANAVLRGHEQDFYREQPPTDRQMSEPDKDAEIERLKQLLQEAIPPSAWIEEARSVVRESTENNKRMVNFRLAPEAMHQLKLLALNKGQPMQTLLCEGLNKVFIENNLPPIAK